MVGTVAGQRITIGEAAADHRSVGAGNRGKAGDRERAVSGRDRLRREAAVGGDERQRRAERHTVEAVEYDAAHADGGRYGEAVAAGHACSSWTVGGAGKGV